MITDDPEMLAKSIGYVFHAERFEQKARLLEFERTLSIGPLEAARRLQTNYNTYKCWKSERNVMPGVAWLAIDLLLKKSESE